MGPEFFGELGRVAGRIADRYGVARVRSDVCSRALNDRHELWKKEIDRRFTQEFPSFEGQLRIMLETLAVALCGSDVIKYELSRHVAPEVRFYQDLVLANPSIFTGLKLVRDQYVNLVIRERAEFAERGGNVYKTPDPGEFEFFESFTLESVIQKIRIDNGQAARFVDLLRIPARSPREE